MKRVVIGGLPRCGTTLLANLLNAQDGCTFIAAYFDAFEQLADTLRVRWDEPLNASQRKAALLKVREQLLAIRHPLLASPNDFETLDDLHSLALTGIAHTGDIAVGHKARLHPTRVERLLTSSDARVIILLRDPRDAAVSWWYRTASSVEPYVEEWKRMVRYVQTSRHARLHAIRFEDLVCRPELALESLLKEVGLTFQIPAAMSALKDARNGATAWQPNSAHGDVTRVLDSAATQRWRGTPRSPVVRYANWACAGELRELGYETMDAAPVAESARFAIARLIHCCDDRFRRLTHATAAVAQRWAPRIEHTD